MTIAKTLLVAACVATLPACHQAFYSVHPVLETDPVANFNDAADDPAIFIHPADPSKNAVIGTDKQQGLVVYDAKGKTVHNYPFGKINNVDLRQSVPWNSEQITLVGGSNRTDNSIVFYRLNEASLELTPLHSETIRSGVDEVYGFCLYKADKTYAFVVGKNGVVEQWALSPGANQQLLAERVRSFDVGGQSEGMVADDELHFLYVAEEDMGIWKYGAKPTDGQARTKVALVGENKALKDDIEGLTLYYGVQGSGYLIASSQGNNSYALFGRTGANAYLGSFRIKPSGNLGGTKETDGIDVSHRSFSPECPNGVFIAQDGKNGKRPQNFKLVDWREIEKGLQMQAKKQ